MSLLLEFLKALNVILKFTGASQPLDRKGAKSLGANPNGTYAMCETKLPILQTLQKRGRGNLPSYLPPPWCDAPDQTHFFIKQEKASLGTFFLCLCYGNEVMKRTLDGGPLNSSHIQLRSKELAPHNSKITILQGCQKF